MKLIKHRRDWSNLLPDLLTSIAGKLSVIDRLSCSHVCSHWNKVFKSIGAPSVPWLVVNFWPPWIEEKENDDENLKFLSLADESSFFKLRLPPPIVTNPMVFCLGSSHGWLIIINHYCEMHLLNPLSGLIIPLPSIQTLPFLKVASHDSSGRTTEFYVDSSFFGNDSKLKTVSSSFMYHFHFKKAVLSAAPVLSPSGDGSWEFSVMMIFDRTWGGQVCFTKAGDNRWTLLHGSHQTGDVIVHRNNFYIISRDIKVQALEPCGSNFKLRLISPQFPAEGTVEFRKLMGKLSKFIFEYDNTHLVETADGELLVVLIMNRGTFVKLFSWDTEGNWRSIKNLGQHVLFLGGNHPIHLPVSACPGFRPNTIYYICDLTGHMIKLPLPADNDKVSTPLEAFFPSELPHRNFFPPLWFSPVVNEDTVVLPQEVEDEITKAELALCWKIC